MEVSPLIGNAYAMQGIQIWGQSLPIPDLQITRHWVFWHDANYPIINPSKHICKVSRGRIGGGYRVLIQKIPHLKHV